VYNEDVSIDFSANVAPFSASLAQAVKGLENMSAASDTTLAKIGKLDNVAVSMVKTFGKFVELNKTATIQAAAYQQKLSGLATVTALNEKQFKGLSDVSLKFAREFPIGLDKSIGMIDTLRTSGVATTKSIKDLGSAFIKVQAASGEWGSEFVSDMLSVNRSFGGSQASAIKFGDSLVSVSNKFGASASSAVGFTKLLAPVASAMGLNATQTLGFSTAFSRLGEDGTRAANALNKVMTDLTVSAKTGSPQISTYAAAMNMSASSLKQLVDTDPAEAVIRFTDAIAKQGPKAIDTLNRLGIDGIQNFKAIQTLGKSSDIRDILQTGANSYGSGSAAKGAKEAFSGVNDQMTLLGDTMNQTVATAGKPFLSLIADLLKGANSFATAIHNAVEGVSNMASRIAPLLAGLKLLHSAFNMIALGAFALKLGRSFANNTELGRSFTDGRTEARQGVTNPGGNFMYRMGQRIEDNMGGLLGRPLKETVGNVFSGAKGALGYGLAGMMNLQTSMLRTSPEEVAPRQLISRNFIENIRSTRIGGDVMSADERKAAERIDKQRVKRGLDPMPKDSGPAADFKDQMKGVLSSVKQFGADLKDSGKGARLLGVTAGTAGGELRVAFAGLAGAAGRAAVALGLMAVKAIGGMVASMAASMGPMIAMTAAFTAFNSIREGTSKSRQLRDEGLKNGLETPGSVYNDFAQKAGLATRSIDALAKSSQNAAHQMVKNTNSMAEANDITESRIAAARNPAYQQAWTFGKEKSASQLANEITNLEGATPNPQARAQLVNDLIKQYGAGTAQQVVNILAPGSRNGTGNVERERTNEEVYSAGFKDMQDKREDRWWSSTYRGLLQLEAVGGTILTLGNKYRALENGLVFNNGMGKYDTEASRDAMSSLVTNISTQVMSTGNVYGARAGQLSQLSELYKTYNAGKNTGNVGDIASIINGFYGTNLKGADVADNNNLVDLLKKTLGGKDATADQKALYEEMFGAKTKENPTGGYAVGQNLADPEFMKVFLESAAKTAQVELDTAAKKINPASKGLADVIFGATTASQRTGFKIEDLTADSNNVKARSAYLNAGKKGSSISLTERVAIDAANRPNDPVAQALQGTSEAMRAMDNNAQNYIGAMKDLTDALHLAADGSAEQTQTLDAISKVQQVQGVYDAGLGAVTQARRDIKVGEEALAGKLPTNEADADVYNQKIAAMNEGYALEISMAKEFVEARNQLNIQLERQNSQYQKNVMRSNRDFNRQLAHQDEDYRISVRRSNEDFAIQRRRQSEDFAKTVYSPFQRISANRTTDASSLVGNLKQQNKVLKTQMANVAKLKKLGLSQQAIDTLDLFNPSNAQEVARLVLDMTANRTLIQATNQQVTTRNELAAQYSSSKLNQRAVREDQDFARRMNNSEDDYQRSVARAVESHATALNDMVVDLRSSISYAYQDLTRFGSEVDITADNIKESMEGAFAGLPKAARDNMSQALKNVASDIKNWKGPTIQFGSEVSLPRVGNYTKKSGRPPKPPEVDALYWNNTMGAGNFYQDPEFTDYFWELDRGKKWNLNTGPVKKSELSKYVNASMGEHAYYYNQKGEHPGYKKLSGYAAGGLITGPGTKTSDSIPARLSHGEYVVKADAVSKYGANFLDGINNMNLKTGNYVHGRESKMSAMQGYATSITHNTSTQYDHSTQINGPITVQSTDPNQFMRQMQAKKRLSRLNQPVGN